MELFPAFPENKTVGIKYNRQQNRLELNLSIFTTKLTLIYLNLFQSAIAQQIRQVSTIYSQQKLTTYLNSQILRHSFNLQILDFTLWN